MSKARHQVELLLPLDVHSEHGSLRKDIRTAGILRPEALPSPEQVADEKRRLALRRQLELELVKSLDQTDLGNRKDCWYLMDSRWLNAWSAFVNYKEPEGRGDEEDEDEEATLPPPPSPGPVSSSELVDLQGVPLKGLQSKIDYRAVPSLVYYVFLEIYGRDASSPDFPRYSVDIYAKPVPFERLVEIQFVAIREAKIRVTAIRTQWIKWEREEEKEEDDNAPLCCCGITRHHVEAIIYWAILCCTPASRKKSGRKDIQYSKYTPMKYKEGDSTRGFDPLADEDDHSGPADKGHESGQWLNSLSKFVGGAS